MAVEAARLRSTCVAKVTIMQAVGELEPGELDRWKVGWWKVGAMMM